MTSNQLKLLAFACMVADHASKAFLLPDGGFSNVIMMIGRISFPIFAFCIAQGYLHTSNIGLYQWRLLLFGILAQPFYITCLSLPVNTLNTLFTFLISITILRILDSKPIILIDGSKGLDYMLKIGALSLLALWLIPLMPLEIHVDYGIAGIALPILLRYISKIKLQSVAIFIWGVVTFGALGSIWNIVGVGIASALICTYSYQRGYLHKYTFYVLYVAHLVVLSMVVLS